MIKLDFAIHRKEVTTQIVSQTKRTYGSRLMTYDF